MGCWGRPGRNHRGGLRVFAEGRKGEGLRNPWVVCSPRSVSQHPGPRIWVLSRDRDQTITDALGRMLQGGSAQHVGTRSCRERPGER